LQKVASNLWWQSSSSSTITKNRHADDIIRGRFHWLFMMSCLWRHW